MSQHSIRVWPVVGAGGRPDVAVYCSLPGCPFSAEEDVADTPFLMAVEIEHSRDPSASWEQIKQRVDGYVTQVGGILTIAHETLRERL